MMYKNIGSRLYISFALLTIPLLYLICSPIAIDNIEIDSANKEMRRGQYISATREIYSALVGLSPTAPSLTDAIAQAEFEPGLALDRADNDGRAIKSQTHESNARKTMRNLGSKLGDSSSLIPALALAHADQGTPGGRLDSPHAAPLRLARGTRQAGADEGWRLSGGAA